MINGIKNMFSSPVSKVDILNIPVENWVEKVSKTMNIKDFLFFDIHNEEQFKKNLSKKILLLMKDKNEEYLNELFTKLVKSNAKESAFFLNELLENFEFTDTKYIQMLRFISEDKQNKEDNAKESAFFLNILLEDFEFADTKYIQMLRFILEDSDEEIVCKDPKIITIIDNKLKKLENKTEKSNFFHRLVKSVQSKIIYYNVGLVLTQERNKKYLEKITDINLMLEEYKNNMPEKFYLEFIINLVMSGSSNYVEAERINELLCFFEEEEKEEIKSEILRTNKDKNTLDYLLPHYIDTITNKHEKDYYLDLQNIKDTISKMSDEDIFKAISKLYDCSDYIRVDIIVKKLLSTDANYFFKLYSKYNNDNYSIIIDLLIVNLDILNPVVDHDKLLNILIKMDNNRVIPYIWQTINNKDIKLNKNTLLSCYKLCNIKLSKEKFVSLFNPNEYKNYIDLIDTTKYPEILEEIIQNSDINEETLNKMYPVLNGELVNLDKFPVNFVDSSKKGLLENSIDRNKMDLFLNILNSSKYELINKDEEEKIIDGKSMSDYTYSNKMIYVVKSIFNGNIPLDIANKFFSSTKFEYIDIELLNIIINYYELSENKQEYKKLIIDVLINRINNNNLNVYELVNREKRKGANSLKYNLINNDTVSNLLVPEKKENVQKKIKIMFN